MKKIGLTQRVEVIASYGERRDCLDQSWGSVLLSLDCAGVPLLNIANKEVAFQYLACLNLDGVILTGGNDLSFTQSPKAAVERDAFESHLIQFCIENKLSILGVCRGMQMLNVHFGGSLSSTTEHVCKNHEVELTDGTSIQVNSYHDWGIKPNDLAAELSPLGSAKDGIIEYCRHKCLPITGIMWHPERMNQNSDIGLSIIKELFL
ncbi:gamma-glutamyl-gamma-aminobutyrate hydrolase family protein [Marinicella rhabdoformis]|uniref:gamma-glutamyl-gamma-aminobutyrate hydrolase family protein n=1 Tax=Marinicella rhabdoformis TaxID=2580566 RepID=UPI0015D0B39D|nr:gamma-glutamyl-gamma-aminobutyrate hydrolase family protein [Marinicella rhabdoformis]